MEKEKLQLILDLITYGDIDWYELRNVLIEKKYINEEIAETIDKIVENLSKAEKIQKEEVKKWQDDFYALRNAFPDLIGNKEFVDTLKEQKEQYEQEYEKLKSQFLEVWLEYKDNPYYEHFRTEVANRIREIEFQIRRLNNLIYLLRGREDENEEDTIKQYDRREKILKYAKDHINIKDFIENETGKLFKANGSVYFMNCPFRDHLDTNASFAVYRGQKHFYCFGCNRGGDVIEFLKFYYGMNFIDALDYLEKKYGTRI